MHVVNGAPLLATLGNLPVAWEPATERVLVAYQPGASAFGELVTVFMVPQTPNAPPASPVAPMLAAIVRAGSW